MLNTKHSRVFNMLSTTLNLLTRILSWCVYCSASCMLGNIDASSFALVPRGASFVNGAHPLHLSCSFRCMWPWEQLYVFERPGEEVPLLFSFVLVILVILLEGGGAS